MIKILEKNFVVIHPNDTFTLEVKKYIHEHLKKGECIFKMPEDLDFVINAKKHKKNYKVGFLYDLMGVIYPELGKEDKHKMISKQYHFDFTYRQFKTIIDEYEKDRQKYLLLRTLLK